MVKLKKLIKNKITVILITILLSSILLSACKTNSIIGEYIYAEPVYRGGISSYFLEPPPSESYDYLVEKNKDTIYTITNDSIIIEGADYKIVKNNLTFEKKKFKNEYIYGDLGFTDKRLDNLFAKYKNKDIILITEEGGVQSGYCLLLLDDDVFIAWLEQRMSFISELDRIIKK